MKWRKTIIFLMIAIFLFSIAAVSASDVDDMEIASEDANQIELSASNEMNVDNLKTSEENTIETQAKNNKSMSAALGSKLLATDTGTYSGLSSEIGSGGNIELQHDYYTYDWGRTIEITLDNTVIDGKGAIIDMGGSTNKRAFYVSASGVTFKNLTIKNANYDYSGGAIYFSNSATSGTVTNCNFTNNTARYGGAVYFSSNCEVTNCNFTNNTATYGGAVYFSSNCEVTNCNFTNNNASEYGGAVWMSSGNVTNCNFTNNTAKWGGAVWISSGNVTNCNFVDNSANRGGAIFSMEQYTAADTCIFKRNSGGDFNVVIYPPTLDVDDFTTFYGSGEKLTFDLKTNISNVPVTDGNISISVYFKNNETWVVNSSCLSGEGWIPDLPVGSYIAVFDTEYAGFQPVNRTVTITIPDVQYYINVTSDTTINKTVNFTAKSDIPKDILWDGKLLFILPNGTQIEATYGANGTWWAEHTFDAYGEYKVNATYVGLDNVTINNGTITINKVNSTITLDNIVLDYGETKNVTVTTTGATGITAKIGESDVNVDGFVISIPLLDAGNYTLTVTTIPDDDHNSVTKEVNITVNKVNSTLTVGDMVFDYGSSGSTVVSITGADGVNATVVEQPKAVVKVNGKKVSLGLKGMSLDLGAVAKGYTSQKITDNLKKRGIDSALLNLGGNVQVLGTKPDGSLWTVAVENPDKDKGYLGTLIIKDKAIVTSGGYERCFKKNGKTYHHILNPENGYPAESGLVSATAVCENGALADALSTALFVMGKGKAERFWADSKESFDIILYTDKKELIISEGLESSFSSDMKYRVIKRSDYE